MKVLVLEDDRVLAAQISVALQEAGYTVEVAHTGLDGEFLGATETVAAAVLDLGLPGLDGLEVLRRWRAQALAFPVLILTAREGWADKVAGFRAGADDYLIKPFRMEEMLLRLAALIRRSAGHARTELRVGPLSLDTVTGAISLDGLPLKLTAFEAKLLRHFMLYPVRVISRAELYELVYTHDVERDFRSLEVVIGRLRRKIAPVRIEAQRGEGYRLVAETSP